MKKLMLAAACALAAMSSGCGGGGGDAPSDTVATAAHTEFTPRMTRQGDERVYEIVEKYNDDATVTYTRRTVQTTLNADRSGERQTFDLNGALVQSLRYDANNIRSVTFYPSGMTCSPNVALNVFPDTLVIGQTVENKYTESCSNGYSYRTEEAATITGTETIDVNRASYGTVKESTAINIEAVPSAPGENFQYSATQTTWIEPALGLPVKETIVMSYPVPPQGHYLVSSTRTLLSYVNK